MEIGDVLRGMGEDIVHALHEKHVECHVVYTRLAAGAASDDLFIEVILYPEPGTSLEQVKTMSMQIVQTIGDRKVLVVLDGIYVKVRVTYSEKLRNEWQI